jgi:hypothetical protein
MVLQSVKQVQEYIFQLKRQLNKQQLTNRHKREFTK